MFFTISIFFFSIALAFAIIARKVWQFRTGRIVPGGYEEADWTDLSIESIRMRLVEVTKFSIHYFVLLILKIWIISAHFVRRIDRMAKEKLMHLLHKNAHLPPGGKPSRFLKNIRDHKDEVASAMNRETKE